MNYSWSPLMQGAIQSQNMLILMKRIKCNAAFARQGDLEYKDQETLVNILLELAHAVSPGPPMWPDKGAPDHTT